MEMNKTKMKKENGSEVEENVYTCPLPCLEYGSMAFSSGKLLSLEVSKLKVQTQEPLPPLDAHGRGAAAVGRAEAEADAT